MESRVRISPTRIAARMIPYFNSFVERGSLATCDMIENPELMQKDLLYLTKHRDEVNWDELQISDSFQFILVMVTINEDLKQIEFLNRVQKHWETLAPSKKQSVPISKRIKKAGFIYLIKAITAGDIYKIGLTKSPDNRSALLGVLLPFPTELVHLIKTDDMRGLEKSLHDKYAEKRMNGEWFALSPDDVAEICSMKGIE